MNTSNPVLIVDDNEDEAFFLSRAFKKAGLSNPITFLLDGEDAIAYLKGEGEYSDRRRYLFPQVVILDLKMGRLGGLEVLEWLRNHPECRVIPTMIYSHSKLPQDVKKAYQLGANAYFYKPTNPEELTTLVKIIMQFWQAAEIPPMVENCA